MLDNGVTKISPFFSYAFSSTIFFKHPVVGIFTHSAILLYFCWQLLLSVVLFQVPYVTSDSKKLLNEGKISRNLLLLLLCLVYQKLLKEGKNC